MTRLLILLFAAVLVSASQAELPDAAASHAILRGTYQNARIKFERGQTGHVAFLGGSITQNTGGHTAMVPAWLEQRFPGPSSPSPTPGSHPPAPPPAHSACRITS
jgi:hypothetical protein